MPPLMRALLVFCMFPLVGIFFATLARAVPLFLCVRIDKVYAVMFAAVLIWTSMGLIFSIWFYTRESRVPEEFWLRRLGGRRPFYRCPVVR